MSNASQHGNAHTVSWGDFASNIHGLIGHPLAFASSVKTVLTSVIDTPTEIARYIVNWGTYMYPANKCVTKSSNFSLRFVLFCDVCIPLSRYVRTGMVHVAAYGHLGMGDMGSNVSMKSIDLRIKSIILGVWLD